MENAKRYILSLVGEAPIAFYRPFADLAGSATGGLFFSQLVYWTGKGGDEEGWIYKTQKEWEEETFMTRSEQESARKALRKIGVLEEKKKGTPARLFYKINFEELHKWLQKKAKRSPQTLAPISMQKTANKLAKISKQACKKQQSCKQNSTDINAKNNSLYTETTTEITQRLQQLPHSELIYPQSITGDEQKKISETLMGIRYDLQQQILDELAGAILANAIKRGVIPYIRGLISAAKSGGFSPSLGVAVSTARRNLSDAHAQEILTKAKFIIDLENQKKGEEILAAIRSRAKEKLLRCSTMPAT